MAMNNTLGDLNNFLFGQLERLDDPDLSDEALKREIDRAEAMKGVGQTIIDNAKLQLKAFEINDSRMDLERPVPRQLTGGEDA